MTILGYVNASHRRLTDLFGTGETDDPHYSFMWTIQTHERHRASVYTFHVDLSPLEMIRLRAAVRNRPDAVIIWQISAPTRATIDHVQNTLDSANEPAQHVTTLLTRATP